MKIVLDTNVLISGIFFTGPPYQILKAWRDRKFQIILSAEILFEYRRVAEELSRDTQLLTLLQFSNLFSQTLK